MTPDKKEKLKEELKEIINQIEELNKDVGEDVDEIREEVEETGKDVDKIKEEVTDTGKDVDEIKEEVGEILEEVEETGKDVDEIKEDIESIKEDIGNLEKKGFLSRVKSLPEKFEFDDLAQQIVGATILSAPFVVTEEVWKLAGNLQVWQVVAIVLITIIFDVLLFFYTKFQRVRKQKMLNFVPLRILSLLIVTYTISAVMLSIFGVIGGQVTTAAWSVKLVVLVGLFANIGAGTADLIR